MAAYDIPVSRGLLGAYASKDRSVSTAPGVMVMVLIPEWPLRKSRDRLFVSEIIRIYSPKVSQLRFVVSEKDFERNSKSDIENLERYLMPVKSLMGNYNTWSLTWRGWIKAAEIYLNSADVFVMMQLNSITVPTNLAAFVSYLDTEHPYYLGNVRGLDTWNTHGVLYNDKSAYALTRGAVRLVAMRLASLDSQQSPATSDFSCQDSPGANEDKHLATCLKSVGVLPLETRDSMGRERFLLTSPRVRDHFKTAAPYAITFSEIKDVQEYQTLEYYTLKQPYADPFIGLEPPSGSVFRVQGRPDLPMDNEGNNPNLLNGVHTGQWLTSPEAPGCLTKPTSGAVPGITPLVPVNCPCAIRLANGLKGADIDGCVQGNQIQDGDTCKVMCSEGKTPSEAKCSNGILLIPPLKCEDNDDQLCVIPTPPDHTKFLPNPGSYIASKEALQISCEPGYRLPGGLEFTTQECYRGGISYGSCKKCGIWSIKLKGRRYQLPGWDKVSFKGVATDEFEVNAVTTGSKEDPVKNCNQYGIGEQLILQEKGSQTLVVALSCNNQAIDVISVDFRESPWCS
eukprot:CAMPEP_0184481572 /NCGR_PEP_ID=MMETSP0113_2-20130426/3123_1 /TAXON_ID=91329 /ORGANISM="Norrisiella sphaerica, Strain BC52" /LENGTH=566 /DNA_ID=CAMNT_0026860769 /DNA_START=231 /DNA_END=1931 /DNA_ORIENTATION=+